MRSDEDNWKDVVYLDGAPCDAELGYTISRGYIFIHRVALHSFLNPVKGIIHVECNGYTGLAFWLEAFFTSPHDEKPQQLIVLRKI